jgi:hypothetical protein
MAQKPEVQFDQLFPKLYNPDLWMMAYEVKTPKAIFFGIKSKEVVLCLQRVAE